MTKFNRRVLTSSFRPFVTPLEDRTTPTAAIALSNNTLFAFDTATPAQTGTGVAVTGLGTGENLVGIDIRPQNGQLYGLTANGTGGVRLYTISATGVAVPLSATAVQFDDGGGNPVPITGTNFGIDFNPTVDRLRVVTDTGVNFRMNPNTGGLIDGNAGTAGINADGTINGDTTTADAVAYTNNAPNATATTLYALDAASNKLELLNPPNAGTATNGTLVTLNGSAFDFTAVNGFDIPAGIAVGTSNATAAGNALAILSTATTGPTLYTIDLATAKATAVGNLGFGSGGASTVPVQGFAVQPNVSTTGVPFVGVAGNNVIRFNSLTPGTTATAAITGLAANESVVGLDRRPATGQYLALVHNTTAGTVRIATLDPQTGGTTAVGAGIALVDASGTAITFPAGTAFGIDINPTVDKLRVVASTGVNFRADPTTGAAVDGNPTATGVQPDTALNGGSTSADAVAYTNSSNGATATTLYTLDAATDMLFIQNPPNPGTLTAGVGITLAGAALDFTSATGFDIPSTVKVTTANAAATGTGFASLTVAGNTSLYSINLTTGAATKLGNVSTGTTTVVGLSAADVAVASTGLLGGTSFAVGTDSGVAGSAKLYNADQTVALTSQPFGSSFTGGVRTATADFNGDGVADLVVGTGPGIATDVRIIDGKTGSVIAQVNPFEAAFTGGVFVAAGDVTGDGVPELVITPDQGGGPRVLVFRSGVTTDVLADFFGIDDSKFRGGARAAIGDVNGDGTGDLGVAAGFGGGPRVAVFNGTTLGSGTPVKLFNDFFAFETALRNGVFLALGDVNGDGLADVVAGGGPGGGPRVTVFDGAVLVSSAGATITPISNFFAGDSTNRGGIRVTVKNLDGDGKADVVVGSGTGAGTRVTAYAGSLVNGAAATPSELFPAFNAFDGTAGVFVG